MAGGASLLRTGTGRPWRRGAPGSPPAASGAWRVHRSCCRRCRAGCRPSWSPDTPCNTSSSSSQSIHRCPRHIWISGCGICVWDVPESIFPGRARSPGSWAGRRVCRAARSAGWTPQEWYGECPHALRCPGTKHVSVQFYILNCSQSILKTSLSIWIWNHPFCHTNRCLTCSSICELVHFYHLCLDFKMESQLWNIGVKKPSNCICLPVLITHQRHKLQLMSGHKAQSETICRTNLCWGIQVSAVIDCFLLFFFLNTSFITWGHAIFISQLPLLRMSTCL